MSLTSIDDLKTLVQRLSGLALRGEALMQVPDAYAVLADARLAGRRSETREMQANYDGEMRELIRDIIALGESAQGVLHNLTLNETQKKLNET